MQTGRGDPPVKTARNVSKKKNNRQIEEAIPLANAHNKLDLPVRQRFGGDGVATTTKRDALRVWRHVDPPLRFDVAEYIAETYRIVGIEQKDKFVPVENRYGYAINVGANELMTSGAAPELNMQHTQYPFLFGNLYSLMTADETDVYCYVCTEGAKNGQGEQLLRISSKCISIADNVCPAIRLPCSRSTACILNHLQTYHLWDMLSPAVNVRRKHNSEAKRQLKNNAENTTVSEGTIPVLRAQRRARMQYLLASMVGVFVSLYFGKICENIFSCTGLYGLHHHPATRQSVSAHYPANCRPDRHTTI